VEGLVEVASVAVRVVGLAPCLGGKAAGKGAEREAASSVAVQAAVKVEEAPRAALEVARAAVARVAATEAPKVEEGWVAVRAAWVEDSQVAAWAPYPVRTAGATEAAAREGAATMAAVPMVAAARVAAARVAVMEAVGKVAAEAAQAQAGKEAGRGAAAMGRAA
jgi:hypothetical protein